MTEPNERLRGTVSRDGMLIFRNVTPAFSVTPGENDTLIFETQDANGKGMKATLFPNGDFLEDGKDKQPHTAYWMSKKIWRLIGMSNPLRGRMVSLRQEIGRIVVQDRRLLDATKRVLSEAKAHKGRPGADALRALETAFDARFRNSPNNNDTYFFPHHLATLLHETDALLCDEYLRVVVALSGGADDEISKKIKRVSFAVERLRSAFPFVDDPQGVPPSDFAWLLAPLSGIGAVPQSATPPAWLSQGATVTPDPTASP